MAANCRKCGAGYRIQDVSTDRSFVACAHCGAMARLKLAQPQQTTTSRAKPEWVSVEEKGDRTTWAISHEKNWPVATGAFFFALCLSGFAAWVLVMNALSSGVTQEQWVNCSVIFGVALCLTYPTLVHLINTRRVVLRGFEVRVFSGPLPWGGGHFMLVGGIQQLYVKRTHVKPGFLYSIRALTNEGNVQDVVPSLHSAKAALYIEQEMEAKLGIEPMEVHGEFAPQ